MNVFQSSSTYSFLFSERVSSSHSLTGSHRAKNPSDISSVLVLWTAVCPSNELIYQSKDPLQHLILRNHLKMMRLMSINNHHTLTNVPSEKLSKGFAEYRSVRVETTDKGGRWGVNKATENDTSCYEQHISEKSFFKRHSQWWKITNTFTQETLSLLVRVGGDQSWYSSDSDTA